jgi:hypothetical protein
MSSETKNSYRMKIVDGKPVIECRAEEIIGPDGSKSVVVHAPSLSIVGEFLSQMKEKGELNG